MQLSLQKPGQPKKLTEKQQELYKQLNQHLNVEPATFFSDACKIMNGNSDLEAETNLVSHLLREVIGEITNKLLPSDYRERIAKASLLAEKGFAVGEGIYQIQIIDKNPTYRDKIELIVSQFKLDADNENVIFWKEVLADKEKGLHKYAHRSNVQGIRKVDSQFQERWERIQALISFQLKLIKEKILEDYKALDLYLAKPQLSNKDLSAIKVHIPLNAFTLQYFFSKSKQYKSIKRLREKGFFDYPTPPLEHESGGISYPHWPQVQFLKEAISDQNLHQEVLEICLEVKTDNYNVQHPIIELVTKLPPDKAVQFKEVALNWLQSQHQWIDYRTYGELIVSYAKNGYCSEAIELTKLLLKIKPDPRQAIEVEGYKIGHDPVGIIAESYYEDFLQTYIPVLVEHCGLPAFEPMLSSLQKYIEIQSQDRSHSKDDYSDIWRPSIQKDPKHGISNYLITAIRSAATSYLAKYPEKLSTLLKTLESVNLKITRRVVLYLLVQASLDISTKTNQKLITKALLTADEFGDRSGFTQEYYELAQKYASILSSYHREKIWKMIQIPPETDQKGFKEYWQAAHLKPFISYGGKWKKLYEQQIKISGEPKYRAEESKVYMREVKDNSPLTIEKLKSMTPNEVIEYARNWKPQDSDPLERTLEGLGIAISTLVQEDPTNWLQVIDQIPSLDKAYVRSYFDGYVKARKAGKKFSWTQLLELAEKILKDHPASNDKNDPGTMGFDPNWSWCRRTIADLVSDGLDNNDNQIPQKNRKQVWKVIDLLLQDPNPDEKQEKSIEDQHRDKDRDYLTTAINSIRGIAIQAAIEYGIWIKLKLTEEQQKSWDLETQAPELSQALLIHLDPQLDKSPAIRAVFGQQLMRMTWLDSKWMTKNKQKIFPPKKDEQEFFDAAWESYVTYVDPRKQMLDIYEAEYVRAVSELGTRADARHHLVSPDQRLVQHLAFLYIWGFLDFGEKQSIWDKFYDSAPVEARAEVINFLGRSLQSWTNLKPEQKVRLQKLVEVRLAAVRSNQNPSQQAKEFESLSHWFESHLFPIEWRFQVLQEAQKLGTQFEGVHMIIEELENTVASHPLESAVTSKYVTDNDREGWEIISWRANLFSILEKIMQSNNKKAKNVAIESIKNLMAKGYTDFKNILDKNV